MSDELPLLIIVGPTASGKSSLALDYAESFDAEVVSADSVQIYKHFDIGSGKLSLEERRGIPHYGIDLFEPHEEIDASRFGDLATEWIADIRARGRLPIVCGGTYLWIRALVHGLVPAPPRDDAVRERHRLLAEDQGREALHRALAAVDPRSAARLNANDFVRVSRALEVYEQGGVPLSVLQSAHAFKGERHHAVYLGIEHGPDLARRIDVRAKEMMRLGFVEEVERLCGAGYRQSRPMNSVGYRQICAALEREPRPGVEQMLDDASRAMRVFSRRQRTWLRDRNVTWLTPEQAHAGMLPDGVRAALGL
jgi:tRNA dimethylallyltransferase